MKGVVAMKITITIAMALLLTFSLVTGAVELTGDEGGATGSEPAPTVTGYQPLPPIELPRDVLSSGATHGANSRFVLKATAGQAISGSTGSSGFGLRQGFWQQVGAGTCCRLRADINHDGVGPDIADLVYLVTFMFGGGEAPPCMEEADINGDGIGPDISDLVYLVDYMFGGGDPPVPC
jgi:hypothetical protein